MSPVTVDEQTILEELRQIPHESWSEVFRLIRSLRPGLLTSTDAQSVATGADLAKSELIGIWADRGDIQDSRVFAQQLRFQAENRRGTLNVS